MTYNDILRRFRYAVDLSDDAMIDIFSEGGVTLGKRGIGCVTAPRRR